MSPIWIIRPHARFQFKLLINKPRHRICVFSNDTPQFIISKIYTLHKHFPRTLRSTRIVRDSR